MKKLLTLIAVFASFANLSAISYCECGLYAGVQAGWAIIKSPTQNDLKEKESENDSQAAQEGNKTVNEKTLKLADFRKKAIESNRGSFAWGINAGYNYPIFPELLIGVETGYHDNGSSSYTFDNKNQYSIESTDWELLGAGTYIFYPGLWANLKVGAARIRQVSRIWYFEELDIDPTVVAKTWQPTTTISLGYNFCNFDLYVAYRFVYGRNQSRLSNTFDVVKAGAESSYGILHMKDESAWVHAIYVGLQASIY